MCNGIAIVVWEKNGNIKGLCAGISSHDELCKLDDDLRYGVIEPYRFELLYPCNLVYDCGYDLKLTNGIFKEQPPYLIWEKAFEFVRQYVMKHALNQLQYADMRVTDMRGANMRGANMYGADMQNVNMSGADMRVADMRGANMNGVNLSGANLSGANLSGANLSCANLSGTKYDNYTLGLKEDQKKVMKYVE